MVPTLRNSIFLVTIALLFAAHSVNAEIRFVSVVFRHGDRSPDNTEDGIYPTDPYKGRHELFPMGYGELIERGIKRCYKLGQLLRQRYHELLGNEYVDGSIEARSTRLNRTTNTLQLILSALYPIPLETETKSYSFNWPNIPWSSAAPSNDTLFFGLACKRYIEEYKMVVQTKEVIEDYKNRITDSARAKIEMYSGKKCEQPFEWNYLYQTLLAEHSMNLELPSWTREFFPTGILLEASVFSYVIGNYNSILRKLNGGMLMRKITEDMSRRVSKSAEDKKKMALYSGHEINVAGIQSALGVFQPHAPFFCSAQVIELHEIDSKFYVKLLYSKGSSEEFVEQVIPGCQVLCPYNKFLELTSSNYPDDNFVQNCKIDFETLYKLKSMT